MKLFTKTDWKLKTDECETAIEELKKQNDSVAAALAKLDRQVKLKVGFSNSTTAFIEYSFRQF